MDRLWMKQKQEVLELLKSTQDGLSTTQVEERLEQYGENKLAEGKKKTVLQVFLEQFKDMLVLILIIAAIISAMTGGVEGTIVIISVLILNAILGTVQHFKAEQSLESLKAMSAPNARVIRNGEKVEVSAKYLVPGDILLLEAGDVAPADGRILENFSLQVSESALTGESENVNKMQGTIEKEELALGDRLNMVYSGSLIAYGRAVVLVTGTAMNTEIGKIANLMESAQEKTTPLQRNLDDFSKKLSFIILGICSVVFVLSLLHGQSASGALMFAVALAVAAIPEALSSIVTIGLAIGTQKMAKENAIIKNLRAVESLGSVSVICSDKTGTLTQNKMTVRYAYTLDGECATSDFSTEKKIHKDLIDIAVLCNDGVVKEDVLLGDPTETALLVFADLVSEGEKKIRQQHPRLGELPFDSDRKLMTTLNKIGDQIVLCTKGAPDVLLSRCANVMVGDKPLPLTHELSEKIMEQNNQFSNKGLRVLAFAKKKIDQKRELDLDDERNLTFIGLIAMMDPPRIESAEAVANCKKAGIRPVMITGDHKVTATAIAKEIGIFQEGDLAVEGVDVEKMSDEQLKVKVKDISVYARVSPEHKIRIVRAWQENGAISAMTGDGVNDAPALKQADIGIAMGITGTEVSKDAAAMILTDDNFATIVKAVGNGRNVYTNIKNSIQFLLSGNLAGILVVLYTSFLGLPLPFMAVQLLFINLLTDSLPALAINMELPTGDLLSEKPRDPKEGILTPDFMKSTLIQGILISVATIIGYYLGLKENPEMASTMAFATLCAARLFHGFNCRGKRSLLRLQSNPYSYGAFFLGMVLLASVLMIPVLGHVFEVAGAVSANHILEILGLAILPTILIQISRIVRGK